MKDKFGNPLFIHPLVSTNDTLMACFSQFLSNCETRNDRNALREKLLHHFRILIKREEPYKSAALKALIRRLNMQDPIKYPHKSAEILCVLHETLFFDACQMFLEQNMREAFISDKYVSCYLVSDLFKVCVHMFQPEEILLSCESYDWNEPVNSIYILHAEGRFQLLTPHIEIRRTVFVPSVGIIREVDKMIPAVFDLWCCVNPGEETIRIGSFVPPNIQGYKVHQYVFDSLDLLYTIVPSKQLWSEVLRDDETLHVHVNGEEVTSMTARAKTSPYFYLPELKNCSLKLLIEKTP